MLLEHHHFLFINKAREGGPSLIVKNPNGQLFRYRHAFGSRYPHVFEVAGINEEIFIWAVIYFFSTFISLGFDQFYGVNEIMRINIYHILILVEIVKKDNRHTLE